MPYIKVAERKELDFVLGELGAKIETEGQLNYCVTKLCIAFLKGKKLNYATLNTIVGVLGCVLQEFYRRVVNSYEDKKIQENTDVY